MPSRNETSKKLRNDCAIDCTHVSKPVAVDKFATTANADNFKPNLIKANSNYKKVLFNLKPVIALV